MSGHSLWWQSAAAALGLTGHGARKAQDKHGATARLGRRALLLMALLLLLIGSGAVQARAAGAGGRAQHPVLVIIGDSLSDGNGLDHPETQSWPAVLVRTHPRLGRLVNLSEDGYAFFLEGLTSPGGPSHGSQTTQAIAAHPTLIIIWLGVNDVFGGNRSARDTAHDLDLMLGYLAATHARIFVMNYFDATAYGVPYLVPLNRAIVPILARHHAQLIDLYPSTYAIWDNPADVQSVHIDPHPTAKGSVAIAQVVYATLHRDGVL